jgi:ATP-dependent helicase/nuclease subunit A
MADPYDSLALLSLLRSPLVGVSLDGIVQLGAAAQNASVAAIELLPDFDLFSPEDAYVVEEFLAWFKPASARADKLPAWEALGDLFAAVRLEARMAARHDGRQLVANARKVLLLAVARREFGVREFAAWLEDQTQIRSDDGDAAFNAPSADAVQIGTVHTAKGMEWKTVIVDAYEWKPPREYPVNAAGIAAPVLRSGTADPIVGRLAMADLTSKESAEELRLLYVALTRAQDRLVVAISDSAGPNRWEQFVRSRIASDGRGNENVDLKDQRARQPEQAAQPSTP